MIDNFALGLIHLLLGIAVWKLLMRDDLDNDPQDRVTPPPSPRRRRRDRP